MVTMSPGPAVNGTDTGWVSDASLGFLSHATQLSLRVQASSSVLKRSRVFWGPMDEQERTGLAGTWERLPPGRQL